MSFADSGAFDGPADFGHDAARRPRPGAVPLVRQRDVPAIDPPPLPDFCSMPLTFVDGGSLWTESSRRHAKMCSFGFVAVRDRKAIVLGERGVSDAASKAGFVMSPGQPMGIANSATQLVRFALAQDGGVWAPCTPDGRSIVSQVIDHAGVDKVLPVVAYIEIETTHMHPRYLVPETSTDSGRAFFKRRRDGFYWIPSGDGAVWLADNRVQVVFRGKFVPHSRAHPKRAAPASADGDA